MFHYADEKEIKEGKVADVYFERTKKILEAKKVHKIVRAEFVVKSFPYAEKWGVLAGIEEAIELLKGLKVNSVRCGTSCSDTSNGVKVRAMPEGTIFALEEPVLEIEGDYLKFGLYETAILGFLCQASGIATKAARCKKLAGEKIVLSFGARRMHPSLAPMIERNAYIGGCDGVATIKAAELLGIEPSGTMPHSLILLFGDTVKALKAFDEIIEPKIKRIALIDTFQDEKFEALNVAKALGKKLYAVRFDTPSSRRGNFFRLLEEVRWELDLRGFGEVKLFVSGGIDEKNIYELNPLVDGYGIGTAISNAPVMDFAMDIVEIDGEPIAKRGKMSGAKNVYRCPTCFVHQMIPQGRHQSGAYQENKPKKICNCNSKYENLLNPIITDGKLLRPLAKPQEIRKYVLDQLKFYPLTL